MNELATKSLNADDVEVIRTESPRMGMRRTLTEQEGSESPTDGEIEAWNAALGEQVLRHRRAARRVDLAATERDVRDAAAAM